MTPRRFQTLGFSLGFSDGWEKIHYLLEIAFVRVSGKETLSSTFISNFASDSFETNHIYSILHEPIYCQQKAGNWSAKRIMKEFPEFDVTQARKNGNNVLFTGEMIFPWFFQDYEGLVPLAEAANHLAKKSDWPELYSVSQLEKNEIPVAAIVYTNDMYVARTLSLETASKIKGIQIWETSELQHNGLWADGEGIFSKLMELLSQKSEKVN